MTLSVGNAILIKNLSLLKGYNAFINVTKLIQKFPDKGFQQIEIVLVGIDIISTESNVYNIPQYKGVNLVIKYNPQ